MQELTTKNALRLCSARELDLEKTFECGQCFRWNRDGDGAYVGVALGRAARLWTDGGSVYILDSVGGDLPLWRDYFDLDLDYEAISRGFCSTDYLSACVKYGMGIRLLRQEPWEGLCSFIISQCNNIPRIKGIVERLCTIFGEPIDFLGRRFYTFPDAHVLSGLSESDLAPLRCGYRAEYILIAARAVDSGELDLEYLMSKPFDEKIRVLRQMKGVGAKVANCAALYGLHDHSGFPIDVWMKRALREHFPPDFDPQTLGEHAGLAQQYIFHYARTSGDA